MSKCKAVLDQEKIKNLTLKKKPKSKKTNAKKSDS